AANAIRIIEAHASKIYFKTLSVLLPPEYRFDGRSRQPAQDLFNAFLNFGYGVLYRQVEKAIASAGLNSYGGFLHTIERNQKAFLFDVVEIFRPWMDYVVFTLCSRKVAMLHHLRAHKNGYWLSQTGKALLLETYYEMYEREQPAEEQPELLTWRQSMRQETRSIAQTIRKEWRAPIELEALPLAA
ncbi:MAG: CRISPR-associated endonuclease Cas1, partial [Bacteroidota bacterium]